MYTDDTAFTRSETYPVANMMPLLELGRITKGGMSSKDCSELNDQTLLNKPCVATTLPTTSSTKAPTTTKAPDNGGSTIIIAVVASVVGLACVIIIVAAIIRASSHTPVNNVNVTVENKTVEGKGGEMMVGLPTATPMTYPPGNFIFFYKK